MLTSLFQGVYDTSEAQTIELENFLLCVLVSLVIGVFLAWVYSFRSAHTKSFVATLAILPAMVCVVIMMVNGNLGAGVATAGAFSLVRFRSATGSAKEIGMIFMAMGAGLIAGMGYLGYAGLFALIMGCAMLLLTAFGVGSHQGPVLEKTLKITAPAQLDYYEAFEEIFDTCTRRRESVSVKVSGKDGNYKLTYNITLKDLQSEKTLIEEVRKKTGNLEVSTCRRENNCNEL